MAWRKASGARTFRGGDSATCRLTATFGAAGLRLLALDPHSPMDLRANAARNLTEFHEAFGVSEGDGMWVAPDDRVRIF